MTDPMTVGDLARFARAHPAGAEEDAHRRHGQESGYPPCCVEFFTALVRFKWFQIPGARGIGGTVESYWALVALTSHRGYIPCPACLGVPWSTPLDPRGHRRPTWDVAYQLSLFGDVEQEFADWLAAQEARRRAQM
jgi:hypothetical protein